MSVKWHGMMGRVSTVVLMAIALTFAGCTTSSAPASSRPTPQQVGAFVALAEKGFHLAFSATYRTVGNSPSALGSYVGTLTAVQSSWPLSRSGMVSPHFKYEQTWTGERSEIFYDPLRSPYNVPRPYGQEYTCAVLQHSVTWSCAQVGPGNLGDMLVGGYLPMNALTGLQTLTDGLTVPPLPRAAYLSHRVVNGRNLTCLNFGPQQRPRATVCLTSSGIIGYYSSQVLASSEPLSPTSLTSLSFHVTRAELTLPAKAKAARGA